MTEGTKISVEEVLGAEAGLYEVYLNGTKVESNNGTFSSSEATVKERSEINVNNKYTAPGSLKISKVDSSAIPDPNGKFTFRVFLENTAGELVPYTGIYKVVDGDGHTIAAKDKLYAGNGGSIELMAGETAVIENLIDGTSFLVLEENSATGQYATSSVTVANADPIDVGMLNNVKGFVEQYRLTYIAPNARGVRLYATGSIKINDQKSGASDATVTVINTINTKSITLYKQDDKGNALEGAQFTLAYKSDSEGFIAFTDADASTARIYKPVIEDDGTAAKITIGGLPYGRVYKLVESKAPNGYNILHGPIYFKIDTTGTVSLCGEDGEVSAEEVYDGIATLGSGNEASLTILNTPGARLPNTGGMGTMAYTLGGMLLIAFAGLMLLLRKKEY